MITETNEEDIKMKEIKCASLRAKYERKVLIIYKFLKIISAVFAIVGISLLVVMNVCASTILNENNINLLGIISFCSLMASPIAIISAAIYYVTACDYSEYAEKKNKKWLI